MKKKKDTEAIRIIKRKEIIKETAKSLEKEFTIPKVKSVYNAVEETIKRMLLENDNIQIRPMQGLVITSTIKPEHTNYIMPDGKKVIQPSRKWLHAKITRYFNRNVVNNLVN